MIFKYFCLFLLLISGQFAIAYNADMEHKLTRIDSLIHYRQFHSATKETSDLYNQYKQFYFQVKYRSLLLELKYRQALILDSKQIASVSPLKILLEIKDKAEEEELHSLCYRIYLLIALAYEKSDILPLANIYLNKAYETSKEHKLESLHSTYYIRRSSYCRFMNQIDSSLYYANLAKEYAKRYGNEKDLTDSYILLGNALSQNKRYVESLRYLELLIKQGLKTNDTNATALYYCSTANVYFKMKNYAKALQYSDTAYHYYNRLELRSKYHLPSLRYRIYEASGDADSAFFYFKQYHKDFQLYQQQEEMVRAKELEEQYQNQQKEAIIKSKDQQILFIIAILCVIITAIVIISRKNRKINSQNKIISKQLEELMKTLAQKQVLLSELQHRVKNNLQHVISILEIQKESVDFNNIEELIRGNQNRVHSMALLHSKLSLSDNVHEVVLKKYLLELSELVKDSYKEQGAEIELSVLCSIDKIDIETALPLGLIIVELVSNSMKHAFRNQNFGNINIDISKDEEGNKRLYYADNGCGFNFDNTERKGLGLEIIKGLIEQLSGNIKVSAVSGFELTVLF